MEWNINDIRGYNNTEKVVISALEYSELQRLRKKELLDAVGSNKATPEFLKELTDLLKKHNVI